MSTALHNHQFPSAIKGKLQSVRWRHATISLAFALTFALAACLVLMLVSMAIDWIYPFASMWLRVVLTGSTLMASVGVAAWLGTGPVRHALQWARAASAVDHDIPELEERWSTVTSLSARDAAKLSPLERAMAAQVTSEAIAMERIVQPRRVDPPVSLRPAIVSAAAAFGLMAVTFSIAPQQTSILMRRFFSPTSTLAATQLTSLTGDQVVPRGEPIELVIEMQGMPRSSATLTVMSEDGQEKEYRLRPSESEASQFTHSLRVDESMSYRVRAGDGQTSWHRLQAIDYPELEEVRLTIEFPEYTGRESVERDRFPRQIKALQGSVLRVAFKPIEPLQRCALSLSNPNALPIEETSDEPNDAPREQLLAPDANHWYHFEMPLVEDVLLQPMLVSRHGLENRRRQFTRIDVIADKAPVARVTKPTDEVAVAEDATIEIEFEAHDDHGVATAELVIFDESQRDAEGNAKVLAVQPVDLGDQAMQRHVMGKTVLDLKQLALSEGQQVSYAVRVTDNRNAPMSDEPASPKRADPTSTANRESSMDDDLAERMLRATAAKENARAPSKQTSETVSKDKQSAAKDSESESEAKSEADSKAKSAQPAIASDIAPPMEKTETDKLSTEEAKAASKSPASDLAKQSLTESADTSEQAATSGDAKASNKKTNRDVPPQANDQAKPAMVAVSPAPKNSVSSNVAAAPKPTVRRNIDAEESFGQNAFTDRRRLKITATLSAIAEAKDSPAEQRSFREAVVEIERRLSEIETEVRKLVDHAIADADRGEQWKRLDASLEGVETFVADLRQQTKDNEYAFVGLQMVDITRTHVTPARDRVFAGSQRPAASDVDAKMALQHVIRARELLAALLKRYDRVEQETKLKEEMDEAVTLYEVYVKKRSVLMREARQNLNPLERKLGIIEVDQAYLDRLAEVQRLRREMMEEFAQMLGDDPRLLSRFMELTKRRQASLRDQLTEISQRQFDMTEEALNWLQIDETQREDLWGVMVDLRLVAADDLAKDAAELSERVEKQMPLEVELAAGTPTAIIAQAKQIATAAHTIRMDADDVAAEYGKAKDPNQLNANAKSLVIQCERLFSLLDRLQFENNANAGINQYVESRIQEARAVADQANLWANLSSSIATSAYHHLLESEQHRLAISTQLLRVEMLDMEVDLNAQFQQVVDTDLPGDIADMIRTLHRLMESITFNQLAASFRAGKNNLDDAAKQQQMAADRLAEAESLFDKIRRTVVERLDENNPANPNIADLRDPTLDAFLARLEREPNIAAQLGIPDRQTNLRIQADSLLWQQSTQGALGLAANAAGERARQAMKMQQGESDVSDKQGKGQKQQRESQELSESEKQQREEAKRAQDHLAKTLAEIEKQRADQELPAAQRERLEEMAKELRKLLEPGEGDESASQVWRRIVQADQAEELMRAVAAGEPLADEQWNRLMSTLDDGLWQTRGTRPPEAYRKAIEQYQDQIRELLPTVEE